MADAGSKRKRGAGAPAGDAAPPSKKAPSNKNGITPGANAWRIELNLVWPTRVEDIAAQQIKQLATITEDDVAGAGAPFLPRTERKLAEKLRAISVENVEFAKEHGFRVPDWASKEDVAVATFDFTTIQWLALSRAEKDKWVDRAIFCVLPYGPGTRAAFDRAATPRMNNLRLLKRQQVRPSPPMNQEECMRIANQVVGMQVAEEIDKAEKDYYKRIAEIRASRAARVEVYARDEAGREQARYLADLARVEEDKEKPLEPEFIRK